MFTTHGSAAGGQRSSATVAKAGVTPASASTAISDEKERIRIGRSYHVTHAGNEVKSPAKLIRI